MVLFLKFILEKGDSSSWEFPEQLAFTCLVVMGYCSDVRQYSITISTSPGPLWVGKFAGLISSHSFLALSSLSLSLGSP